LTDDPFWKQPAAHDFARQAVIPPATADRVLPWSGLDLFSARALDSEGRYITLPGRLLDAAAGRQMLGALEKEIEAALGRLPQWSGGRPLLALIQVRQGRGDQVGPTLESLLLAPSARPPFEALIIAGQELTADPSVQRLALAISEKAVQSKAGGERV